MRQLYIRYSELPAWGQNLFVWLLTRWYVHILPGYAYHDLVYFSAHTARALAGMIYKV